MHSSSVLLLSVFLDCCLCLLLLFVSCWLSLSSVLIAQSESICLSFECGFVHFSDSRQKYNVTFYLVGILFIIFDIEVTVLFPWSLLFKELPISSALVVLIFIGVLSLGFLLEWLNGAFDWKLCNYRLRKLTRDYREQEEQSHKTTTRRCGSDELQV